MADWKRNGCLIGRAESRRLSSDLGVRQDQRVRILVASDLHYRLPHFDWLVRAADGVDVVALVGDLADVVSPVPLELQVVVLDKYLGLLSERAVLLVASGNHDLDGPGAHGEQVAGWLQRPRPGAIHVDGASVDIDGVRFTICPWWDGPVAREEVERQIRSAAVGRPERWAWRYHAPPAGTVLCRDGRREFPDHHLAGWIQDHEPDMVFCGHIHQAPWTDGGSWNAQLGPTWVFNAGRQVGPVPPHLTWDTDAQTVEWFGVFSSDSVSLG